jgi:hypothetical protein
MKHTANEFVDLGQGGAEQFDITIDVDVEELEQRLLLSSGGWDSNPDCHPGETCAPRARFGWDA